MPKSKRISDEDLVAIAKVYPHWTWADGDDDDDRNMTDGYLFHPTDPDATLRCYVRGTDWDECTLTFRWQHRRPNWTKEQSDWWKMLNGIGNRHLIFRHSHSGREHVLLLERRDIVEWLIINAGTFSVRKNKGYDDGTDWSFVVVPVSRVREAGIKMQDIALGEPNA